MKNRMYEAKAGVRSRYSALFAVLPLLLYFCVSGCGEMATSTPAPPAESPLKTGWGRSVRVRYRAEVFSSWERLIDQIAGRPRGIGYESSALEKLGAEGPVLAPFIEATLGDKDHRRRKVIATLTGWMSRPDPGLLSRQYQHELSRVSGDDLAEGLKAHSVVEDLVSSAIRWHLRGDDPEVRKAGISLLVDVVRHGRTSRGWNSEKTALLAIIRYSTGPARTEFSGWLRGEPQGKLWEELEAVRRDSLQDPKFFLEQQDRNAKDYWPSSTVDEAFREFMMFTFE